MCLTLFESTLTTLWMFQLNTLCSKTAFWFFIIILTQIFTKGLFLLKTLQTKSFLGKQIKPSKVHIQRCDLTKRKKSWRIGSGPGSPFGLQDKAPWTCWMFNFWKIYRLNIPTNKKLEVWRRYRLLLSFLGGYFSSFKTLTLFSFVFISHLTNFCLLLCLCMHVCCLYSVPFCLWERTC